MGFLSKVGLPTAAALVLSLAPATAAEALIKGFNAKNVQEIAGLAGASDFSVKSVQAGAETITTVGFKHEDRVYVALLTVCGKPEGCLGVNLMAIWQGAVPLDGVNEFNTRWGFGKVFVTKDATVSSRYIIADYGSTKENLASEFSNMFAVSSSFLKFMQERKPVAAAPAQSKPVAHVTSDQVHAIEGVPIGDLPVNKLN